MAASNNALLLAALAYAARGWPVFPCHPATKRPLVKSEIPGEGGVKLATTDPDTIRGWWGKWSKAMIGLATGAGAGVFVVDFDPGEDKETGEVVTVGDLLARLESAIGAPLPVGAWSVATPSGGVHIYFRHAGGSVNNRAGLLGKRSRIDIRGDGGYVILPPSVRPDGKRYAWGAAQPAATEDAIAAPAELVDCVLRRGRWAPGGEHAATSKADVSETGSDQLGADRAEPPIAAAPGAAFKRPARAAGANGGTGGVQTAGIQTAGDRAVANYVATAFAAEIRTVERAGQGQRNWSLNVAAVKLGELIAAGLLDRVEVEGALTRAAEVNGELGEDGPRVVANTIASGLRKGLAQPRDVREIRRKAEERETVYAARYSAPPYETTSAAAGGRQFELADVLMGEPPEPPADLAPNGGGNFRDYANSDFAAAASPPPPPPPPVGGEKIGMTRPFGRDGDSGQQSPAPPLGESRPPPDDAARLAGLVRKLAFFPLTDLGNAERFVERFRGRLLWCPVLGWLWWDGKRWSREGADRELKKAEHDTVRGIQVEADWLAASDQDFVVATKGRGDNEEQILYSDRLRAWGRESEANRHLVPISKRAEPYLYVAPQDLDADPFKFNVANGTIVARRYATGDQLAITFRPHDPDDRMTRLSPVEYDPRAACPAYDQFMLDVQPSAPVRRFLHAWGGLSLTGDMTEQRLVFCWGKGRNGKSTLLEAWARVLGDYAKSVPVETFISEGRSRNAGQATPDLAMLKGVRFVHTNEPEKRGKLSEGIVKLVTGGDEIPVRELNQPYFMLRPQFKLIMSGNFKPKIDGGDPSHGIWRRMTMVPWVVTVAPENVDRRLPEKLAAESSGILNRLLDGLRDWLDNGLVLPEEVVDATEQYRSDSDPLGRFLAEATIYDMNARTQSSVLHQVFVGWCRVVGEREWSQRGFGDAMRERGFERKKSDDRFWLGVKLIKTINDYLDNEGKPLASAGGDAGDRRAVAPVDPDDEMPV